MNSALLCVIAGLSCAAPAVAVHEENWNFKVECVQSVPAKKTRNTCCHKRGGGQGLDGRRCEAEETAGEERCESGCFMIDRSENSGGHKMCKPICEARNLVSKEEVNKMKADAQQAVEDAATSLKEWENKVETGSTLTTAQEHEDAGKELTAAKEADVAAKIKLDKINEVEAQFPAGEDEHAVEAEVKKEEKVVVAAVKDAAVEACNKLPKGTRLDCCGEACRNEMESVYPGEMRMISPMNCALPCNNAPDRKSEDK